MTEQPIRLAGPRVSIETLAPPPFTNARGARPELHMLTRMRFKNFKGWRDSGEIRLAPLTVLFGTNSAGKTSLPQLLLLLKQTAASPDRQQPLQLGDPRTMLDLGTYAEVVHGHATNQPLDFDFSWRLPEELQVTNSNSGDHYTGDSLRFSASIVADAHDRPVVHSIEYELSKGDERTLDISMRRKSQGKFELHSKRYALVRQPGRVWPLPAPIRFYGFPDEAVAHFQNSSFVSDLVLALERLLRDIYYVGPLREEPQRLYLWSGETPEHVGRRGDRAIEALLAAGDRKFNLGKGQHKKSLDQVVAERLESMGLIHSFAVQPLGARRKEYEVLVRTRKGAAEVKLTDVGFGVSQLLPVIVECFYVPSNSLVIFEQPEIHLHPKVQGELADLFIDAIHAREAGKDRRCQFIVESHSEHFLRRLQRRIAEEKLGPQEAALYYVHTDGAESRIEELPVDLFGNIANWPEGFFGDEMEDLVARTEAQARRTEIKKAR